MNNLNHVNDLELEMAHGINVIKTSKPGVTK